MEHQNELTGGMKGGIDYTLMPQDSYLYCLNGYHVSKDEHGVIMTNIKGTVAVAQFAVGEYPIGTCQFANILYIVTHIVVATVNYVRVYSLDGWGTNSWDKAVMKLIPSGNDGAGAYGGFDCPEILGFTRDNLIEVLAKESYDGSVDLYLCDGINNNVIINTGISREGTRTGRFYATYTMPLFSQQNIALDIPLLDSYSVEDDALGKLKGGAYYIYLKYLDDSLNETPFLVEFGPFYIYDNNANGSTGVSGSAEKTKRLILNISNIDLSKAFYKIGVYHVFGDNGISAPEIYELEQRFLVDREHSITTATISINGDEAQVELIDTEIYDKNVSSNISLTETQINNRWYGANWKSVESGTSILSDLAKLILPYSSLVTDDDGIDRHYGFDDFTTGHDYMDNELYPLGVAFLINGGYMTDVFPICGWNEGIAKVLTGYPTYTDPWLYNDNLKPLLNTLTLANKTDVLSKLNNVDTNDEKVGIYMFPHKRDLGSSSRYDRLTLNVDLTIMMEAFNALQTKPNINAIYIVQGDRLVNIVTQGLMVSCVNQVGYDFYTNLERWQYNEADVKWESVANIEGGHHISQVDKMGYQTSDSYVENWFPWLDASNYQLFPVNAIPQFIDLSSNFENFDHYINFLNISLAQVLNNEVLNERTIIPINKGIYATGTFTGYYWRIRGFSDSIGSITDLEFYYPDVTRADFYEMFFNTPWELKSNRFALYTPDILMYSDDEGYILLDGVKHYVRPIGRFDRIRTSAHLTDLGWEESIDPDDRNTHWWDNHPDLGPKSNGYTSIAQITQTVHDRDGEYNEGTGFRFRLRHADSFNWLLDESVETLIYDDVSIRDSYYPFYAHNIGAIGENIRCNAASNLAWEGMFTNMTHYTEYVGTDFGNYTHTTREGLWNNGVALNRVCNNNYLNWSGFSLADSAIYLPYHFVISLRRANAINPLDTYKYWPVGVNENDLFTVKNIFNWDMISAYGSTNTIAGNYCGNDPMQPNEQVPVVMTNLDMLSIPFVGLRWKGTDGISPNDRITYNSGQDMYANNSIVNLCRYDDLDTYITTALANFESLSERYHLVSTIPINSTYSIVRNNSIERGDLFSQKTYMKLIEWSNDCNMNTLEWNQGVKQCRAMNIYLQSRVNTYLRIQDVTYDFKPYNTDTDNVWMWDHNLGEKRESFNVNDGYNLTKGYKDWLQIDNILFNIDYRFKNRIYWSNNHESGSIIDSYKEIPLSQYKDFRFDAGAIMRIINLHDNLFSIQEHGINMHQIGNKNMIADDESTVILGNPDVLSEDYMNLSTYGTQHKDSVVVSRRAVYGVDWNDNKIWIISQQVSQNGRAFYSAEDLGQTKYLFNLFTYLKGLYQGTDKNELSQAIYSAENVGIISTVDHEKELIYFTFKLGLDNASALIYRTLVYSEGFGCFVGYFSIPASFYANRGERLFSFSHNITNATDRRNLWEHNKGGYQNIYNIIEPFELTFIVNGLTEQQNTAQFEKEFHAHLITMCPEILESMSWETEWQTSTKNPFLNVNEFWSNPEYFEHTWRVTVMPNSKVTNNGPLDIALPDSDRDVVPERDFYIFEDNSNMRGKWLKVTLRYTGVPYKGTITSANMLYIKNIITNFIISKS